MPRAEEMIEKVDLRDHAPAADAADLTIAAVHPGSFWRDQAAERRADDESGDHPAAGHRVSQDEGGHARASQSEAFLQDSEGLSEPVGQAVGSPGAPSSVQQDSTSRADQEAPAFQAPASAGATFGSSGHGAPAVTTDEAGAEIPVAPSLPDGASAAPPVAAGVGALPIPELAPVISGALDALEGAIDGVTEAVPDVLDTAASALPLTATVVEPVGDLAPGLLQSLFQPEGDGGSGVAGLDPGNLQPLDSGAMDNIAEDAASALPLADPDALLGSDDHGGPVGGLLDL